MTQLFFEGYKMQKGPAIAVSYPGNILFEPAKKKIYTISLSDTLS
jgi:hypothetical protein